MARITITVVAEERWFTISEAGSPPWRALLVSSLREHGGRYRLLHVFQYAWDHVLACRTNGRYFVVEGRTKPPRRTDLDFLSPAIAADLVFQPGMPWVPLVALEPLAEEAVR